MVIILSPCVLVAAVLFLSGKFFHCVVGNCLASVGLTFSMEHNLGAGATSESLNSLVWFPFLFCSSVDFLSDSGRLVRLYLSTSRAQIFLCCHASSFKFMLICEFLKLISPSMELVYPSISLLILFTVETITSFLFMMHVYRGVEVPIQMHMCVETRDWHGVPSAIFQIGSRSEPSAHRLTSQRVLRMQLSLCPPTSSRGHMSRLTY